MIFRPCIASLFLLVSCWSYGQKIDTLTNLPERTEIFAPKYTQPGQWGYYLGQNSLHRQQFAEKYQIEGERIVIGLIVHLTGTYTHPDNFVEFNVYQVGENSLPDNRLGGKQVFYKDLNLSGEPMIVNFNTPIAVEDSFYVSFNVFDYVHGGYDGDTLGLYMGVDGSRSTADLANFGRNAIQAHNHHKEDWKDFYTQNFTPLATHFALYPIVTTKTILAKHLTKPEVSVYPNPASQEVNIKLADPQGNITISNMMGKTLYQTTFSSPNLSLDISSWNTGYYLIHIESGNQTFNKKLFIKTSFQAP